MILNIIIILLLLLILASIYKLKPAPVKPTSDKNAKTVVLDSCAVIDGRIVELAKLGFLPNSVIVPEFVIKELQMLADGRDSHKRERSRFGLEVIQILQKTSGVNVVIDRHDPEKHTVDEKLVNLAKLRGADLYTTDFNLNQVASIEGVKVLNVNELAHALRPVALPGESYNLTIIQTGTNRDQGVGYLEDGTMVVVDGAISDIGKQIKVSITKSHQTVAGKMLFAKKERQATQGQTKPFRGNKQPLKSHLPVRNKTPSKS